MIIQIVDKYCKEYDDIQYLSKEHSIDFIDVDNFSIYYRNIDQNEVRLTELIESDQVDLQT